MLRRVPENGTYFRTAYPVDQIDDEQWTGTSSWIGPDGNRITVACKLTKKGSDKFFGTAKWTAKGEQKNHYATATRKTKGHRGKSIPPTLK